MLKNGMTYKGYFATLQFKEQDAIFHGKVSGLNDLITFEGNSVASLKKAFREAMEDYFETCKKLGREPEKSYKGSFNVRIPSELHRQAARYAGLKNMTLNDFIRYALDTVLSKKLKSESMH